MVECMIEMPMIDFPQVENHSLVFDLFTPWVNRFRLLPGHDHKDRSLPTWHEEDYFQFLAGNPTTCPIVIEARQSSARCDNLKRHTTGQEQFCGIGQMDIYQNLVDLAEDHIVQDVVFKDISGKVPVGKARLIVQISFWPDLKGKLLSSDWRPLSPSRQTLASSMSGSPPLSQRTGVGNWSQAPPVNNYDDVTDHDTAVKANLFAESPNSPLDFRKLQTAVNINKTAGGDQGPGTA